MRRMLPTINPRPGPGRWIFVLAAVVAAWSICIGAVAWACVPQPFLSILPRSSGRSGDDITLEGLNFHGRVEIRWNAVDGPLLATATGSPFSTSATIPDVVEGLYAFVALERDATGGIVGLTRSAFAITGPGSTTTAPVARKGKARSDAGIVLTAGLVCVVLSAIAASWGAARAVRRHAAHEPVTGSPESGPPDVSPRLGDAPTSNTS